nr:uncharacterized protein LOC112022914 [Quercus suber]
MGGNNRSQAQMQLFRDVIDECGFLDLGYVGEQFTWRKHFADGHSLWERLDRGLSNHDWFMKFSGTKIHHLHSDSFDHSPLWITLDGLDISSFSKPFRFEEMWLSDRGCSDIVEAVWLSREDEGDHDHVIRKIDKCGKELRIWNRNCFGNVRMVLSRKRKELKEAEKVAMRSGNNQQVRDLKKEIDDLVDKENRLNSKYFHSHASQRKRKNLIRKLKDSNGCVVEDNEGITDCLVQYYQNLFCLTSQQYCSLATDSIQTVITEEMNSKLSSEFTHLEVKQAINQMAPRKAPGPDGMPPLFYQHYWNLIGDDISKTVSHYLNSATLPVHLNHTFITLIPKKNNPESASEFRPISLCNVFMQKHTGKEGYMAIKLDMSKAYKRVEWSYLQSVMEKMGFTEHWINLMMLCVKTVTYTILVNGEPKGMITPSRGIRQGDPLSPFLFLLCTEGLNGLINKAAHQGNIKGYSLCRNSPHLTHLLFADDSLLFCKATIEECHRVLDILDVYGRCSGQQINRSKMTIFFSKSTTNDTRNQIKLALGVPEIIQYERYLGLLSLEHPWVLSDIVPGFEESRVVDLINPSTRTWDANLVHGLLSLEEAALVLSIPLSRTLVEDKITWPLTPSGNTQQQNEVWKLIWRLNVPNKVRNFMWRACKEAIPAKRNLLRRKILTEDKCEECGVESETTTHALWECTTLDEVWQNIPSFEDRRQLDASNIRELINLTHEKRKDVDLMAMSWARAGLGVVVRNSHGNAIASLSEQALLPFAPVIVEAMAAARAMIFAKEIGITEFMLEGDSEVVINTLRNTEASLSTFGHLLESAKSTLVTSKCIAFSHIRRSGNRVGHNLAKHARHVRGLSVWVEDTPSHLYDVLLAEPG